MRNPVETKADSHNIVASEPRLTCRVCGNSSENQSHSVREMFFGMRDTFDYIECSRCGTVQIASAPDLSRYYPRDYYAFGAIQERTGGRTRLTAYAGKLVRRRAADYILHGAEDSSRPTDRAFRLSMDRLKRFLVGYPEYLLKNPAQFGITRQSAILDIGSGAGATLEALRHFGFTDLTGVDPFIEQSSDRHEVSLLKTNVHELDRQFELILANHSLEHDADPPLMLKTMHRLLKPQHFAVVRMPVLSWAWRTYGVNWVQLDAPRHLFLFTVDTFSRLAAEAGFQVNDVDYDSTAFQFWGSEQYAKDIPLMDERSYFINPDRSVFTKEQIAAYSTEAARLNSLGEGDQAVFYLRRN